MNDSEHQLLAFQFSKQGLQTISRVSTRNGSFRIKLAIPSVGGGCSKMSMAEPLQPKRLGNERYQNPL